MQSKTIYNMMYRVKKKYESDICLCFIFLTCLWEALALTGIVDNYYYTEDMYSLKDIVDRDTQQQLLHYFALSSNSTVFEVELLAINEGLRLLIVRL